MKKTILILAVTFAFATAFAQTTGWKELDAFHSLVSKVFHPAEAGNLKPAKDSAAIVLAKATVWQASAIPVKYDAKTIKPLLDRLVHECSAINNAVVAGKKNTELKLLVAKAHDTFHEILDKCEPPDK